MVIRVFIALSGVSMAEEGTQPTVPRYCGLMEDAADKKLWDDCRRLMIHPSCKMMIYVSVAILCVIIIVVFGFQHAAIHAPSSTSSHTEASTLSLSGTSLYPKDESRRHCELELSEKAGVLFYWNTTFNPARTWFHLCYHGWLYDPYNQDAWSAAVQAWYDGTAEKIFITHLSSAAPTP